MDLKQMTTKELIEYCCLEHERTTKLLSKWREDREKTDQVLIASQARLWYGEIKKDNLNLLQQEAIKNWLNHTSKMAIEDHYQYAKLSLVQNHATILLVSSEYKVVAEFHTPTLKGVMHHPNYQPDYLI